MTRELSPMEKEADEHIVDILKDIVQDDKKKNRNLCLIISLLIILLFLSFVVYTFSFFSFISQYDIENTITTTTTTDNNSKINNSQNTNAQNNINIDFPKISKER